MINVSEVKKYKYFTDEKVLVADINGSIVENGSDLVVKGDIKDITLCNNYSLEKLIEDRTELEIRHYSDDVLKDDLPTFFLKNFKIDLAGKFELTFSPSPIVIQPFYTGGITNSGVLADRIVGQLKSKGAF